MKRGTRFSEKVIAFVLTERSRGKRWNDVRNAVRDQFQIEPPSERQMRSWYKEYGGGSILGEKLLRESLVKIARDSTPVAAFAAQQLAIEQGIPALVKAFERKEDPLVAGGVMILSLLEQAVGKKYDEIVRQYQKMRERRQ